MKSIKWFIDNIFFVLLLFLLAFIPLFPKLPILDIKHTWVYVRLEDFIMVVTVIILFVQLLRKKATLRTPLTIPILLYWGVGLVATVFGILFIFPHLTDVFPQVAFLFWFRHVEYLLLFFVAYNGIREKWNVKYIVGILALTMIAVVIYGFGQKGYLIGFENRFPAFSTMNEEFAKGVPLLLSPLARVSSTFAGHYDLAAYLVMLIAIMGSMVMGVKRWYSKIFFFLTASSGFIVLLMTSSRVSFAVYLLTIAFMLMLQKKKLFIIPVVILSFFVSRSFDGITDRFSSTLSSADLVVDARTGKAIGIAKTISTPEGEKKVVIEDSLSTGENLPQGSSYINVPTGETVDEVTHVTYRRTKLKEGVESTEVKELEGKYIIKKVLAYDVSFTTRFQGTWPRAWTAFERNILLGSGYSSINLASDGNYLRLLGEIGLLGTLSFLSIFLLFGIYVAKVLPSVEDKYVRSFVLGVCAAIFGLGLNAVLIDVFEASKVAFILWMLIGSVVGVLHLYQKEPIKYFFEIKKALTSPVALIVYLLVISFTVYSMMFGNFIVGDDYTWLKWAADCKKVTYTSGEVACEPATSAILSYFTNADGFFYRPGTKTYFYNMYPWFSFNQYAYHVVSLIFHFLTTAVVFLLASRFLRSKFFGFVTSLLFLFLSINAEIIFWAAATGHLVAFFLIALSLLLFLYWKDTKRILLLVFSVIFAAVSTLFYEVGIVAPILIILFDLVFYGGSLKKTKEKWFYLPYLLLIPGYLLLRAYAQSHWLQGDYNYNFVKLPLNAIGNTAGYLMSSVIGTQALPIASNLRAIAKENTIVTAGAGVILLLLFGIAGVWFFKKAKKEDRDIVSASLLLFIVPLLPFLGLGGVSARYVYLSSFGVLLFGVFVFRKLLYRLFAANKAVIYGVTVIMLAGLLWYHYAELVRINKDWKKAGAISQNFLYSLNETYVKNKAYGDNPVFYFVNTPIRYGEAWVFPVGLEDALWFNFQTSNLTIHFPRTLELAFSESEGSLSAKVFEFDRNGDVSEVLRTTTKEQVNKK